MKVLRILLGLMIGGGLGLLSVPLLPQSAHDWVVAWQIRLPEIIEEAREKFPPAAVEEQSPTPGRGVIKPTHNPFATISPPASPNATSNNTNKDLKIYMLELINRDRMSNGLKSVELGDNLASQRHAEELFQNGFLGHWGLDGMKPHMRYTLTGGTGAEAENVSGSNSPRLSRLRYSKTPAKESLREAQEGLMLSPGHRSNILNPWHQKVNLGIACDDVSCTVVQQFEYNYVDFERLPAIEGGWLEFSGRMSGGFDYVNAQIWYDPPPRTLQASQVRPTYCYGRGVPIVFIREPAPPSTFYTSDSSDYSWPDCLDPNEIEPTAPPAKVKAALPARVGRVPWLDADSYEVAGGSFHAKVNLTSLIAKYGRGVYTLVIWGRLDNEDVPLSNYSIFLSSP